MDTVLLRKGVSSRREVATIALFADGRMLWGMRRDSGKWTTPGGHLEPGESPEQGAVRELREEANIEAPNPLRPLGFEDLPNGLRVHCFRLDVAGDQVSASSRNDPDHEVLEWRWVLPEDGQLPDYVRRNLHAPRNALLRKLGMRDGMSDIDTVEKAESKVAAMAVSTAAQSAHRSGATSFDPQSHPELAQAAHAYIRALGPPPRGIDRRHAHLRQGTAHLDAADRSKGWARLAQQAYAHAHTVAANRLGKAEPTSDTFHDLRARATELGLHARSTNDPKHHREAALHFRRAMDAARSQGRTHDVTALDQEAAFHESRALRLGSALGGAKRTAKLSRLERSELALLLKARTRIVGDDHSGKLLHGTTRESAKAFVTGQPLDPHRWSRTLSEFGQGVLYGSDPEAPHQASMFAGGSGRTMVELSLKPGSKLLDISDEVARRPMVGSKEAILHFAQRPSYTEDMGKWLQESRHKKGKVPLSEDETVAVVDPTHPKFNVVEYASLLPLYARDRGYHGIRMHDETVLADQSAIAGARQLKPKEIAQVAATPRAGEPVEGAPLYSKVRKAELLVQLAALRKADSRDIVVCIPRSRLAQVEQEEAEVARQVAAGHKPATYYWTIHRLPRVQPRRVYFAWDGAVRAWHECVGMIDRPSPRLLLDHRIHSIKPEKMDSFRGWRYR